MSHLSHLLSRFIKQHWFNYKLNMIVFWIIHLIICLFNSTDCLRNWTSDSFVHWNHSLSWFVQQRLIKEQNKWLSLTHLSPSLNRLVQQHWFIHEWNKWSALWMSILNHSLNRFIQHSIIQERNKWLFMSESFKSFTLLICSEELNHSGKNKLLCL